jgi:hypothetical protein
MGKVETGVCEEFSVYAPMAILVVAETETVTEAGVFWVSHPACNATNEFHLNHRLLTTSEKSKH